MTNFILFLIWTLHLKVHSAHGYPNRRINNSIDSEDSHLVPYQYTYHVRQNIGQSYGQNHHIASAGTNWNNRYEMAYPVPPYYSGPVGWSWNFNPIQHRRRQHTKMERQEMEEVQKCVGFDNVLNDVGILGLVLGIIAIFLGFSADLLSYISVGLAITSVLAASGPSSILTVLQNLFPNKTVEPFGSIFNGISVVDTLVNILLYIPYAHFVTVLSNVGNVISVISLGMGMFALFPEQLQDVFNFLFGKKFIDEYDCHNPYRDYSQAIIDNYFRLT